MSSFKVFDIAGSGMSAQSVRLNTTASNLANADSVASSADTAYRARHPVFKAVQAEVGDAASRAVQVTGVMTSTADVESRYEPGNSMANAQGFVYGSNVNVVEEMTDMISASRSYQNNVEVMNTSKELLMATLKLGQ